MGWGARNNMGKQELAWESSCEIVKRIDLAEEQLLDLRVFFFFF